MIVLLNMTRTVQLSCSYDTAKHVQFHICRFCCPLRALPQLCMPVFPHPRRQQAFLWVALTTQTHPQSLPGSRGTD